MGNFTTKSHKRHVPCTPEELTVPTLHREGSSLQEKEEAAEFAFMLENMRWKRWLAEDATGARLASVLRREEAHEHADGSVELRCGPVPLDSEGFVQAFDASDAVGLRAFFARFGFAVVRNAIDAGSGITRIQAEDDSDNDWDTIDNGDASFDAARRTDRRCGAGVAQHGADGEQKERKERTLLHGGG